MDERFLDIETKLAYLEDMVDSLNKVIVDQRDELDRLRDSCRIMLERMQEYMDEGKDAAATPAEKPPHY